MNNIQKITTCLLYCILLLATGIFKRPVTEDLRVHEGSRDKSKHVRYEGARLFRLLKSTLKSTLIDMGSQCSDFKTS